MITFERLTGDNAEDFRTVRLAALKDTPSAFGSTHEKESKLTPEEWNKKAHHWSSDRSMAYVAIDGENPCGIVGGFVRDDDPTVVSLVSMWVAPTHRKQGVGKTLVSKIADWAKLQSVGTLQLLVTDKNGTTIDFYKKLGFELRGNTEPYPNDPDLVELEMIRELA